MSVTSSLRRKGLIGVFGKLSHYYWRTKSRVYYAPQFGRFGSGSIIRKPMMIANAAGISIGERTFIRDGARLEVVDRPGEESGRLVIGDGVSMEQGAHIASGGVVTIEDEVCLAARVSILDTAHPMTVGRGNRVHGIVSGPTFVRIGKRAFIGTGSTVLPGVTIGEDAVIGAGSVVVHDIPARSVAVGVPARVIRVLAEAESDVGEH